MWSKARCLSALAGRLPDAYTVEVSFKLPIPLPATVNYAAVPDGADWSLSLDDTRTGRPHLVGRIIAD
jgi:hypothetical protein